MGDRTVYGSRPQNRITLRRKQIRDERIQLRGQWSTQLADSLAQGVHSLTSQERRRANRRAQRELKAEETRVSTRKALNPQPLEPSLVSGLRLDSGLGLRFNERVDRHRAMDPHYVVGFTRQLEMAPMPAPTRTIAIRRKNSKRIRVVKLWK